MRGEEKESGKKVRDYVRGLILDKRVKLKTLKDKTGKYGRYLGIVYISDMNLNDHLVDIGYAKKYMV